MYNIEHIKKEFKEFEIEFYDYKNLLLDIDKKWVMIIKMNFYINILDFFEFYKKTANLYNEKIIKVKISEMYEKWYSEEKMETLFNERDFNEFVIQYLEEL